jgi:hypothetical protein
MFTCAHDELRLSPLWALATPAPAIAAQMAIGMRLLRSTRISSVPTTSRLRIQPSR